jgi:hypothetical protein
VSLLQRRYRTTLYVGLVATAVITLACVDVHIKNGWCDTDVDCGGTMCVLKDHACLKAASPADMSTTPPDLTPPPPCTSDATCPATAPICDTTSKLCRGCGDSDGGISNECLQTSGGANNDRCAPTGACVACVHNADCVGTNQTCDSHFTCGPCTDSSQCATGVCDKSTGACGATKDYIFVNQAGMSCSSGGTGAGSYIDPYCKIQAGLDAMAKNTSGIVGVVVYAGTYGESLANPSALTSYTVKAIGVGQPVIQPTSGGGLALTGTSFNVSLDGFTVQNATGGATGTNGISCSGSATNSMTVLNLYRSRIQGNSKYGIASTACQLNIDQSIIESNTQGGIVATDSTVTIRNSLVDLNGVAATMTTGAVGGIKLQTSSASSTATIVGCTVYGNVVITDPLSPGISCQSSLSVNNVFDTVVFGNKITGGTTTVSEISTSCNPDTSAFVVPPATTEGVNTVDLTGCSAAQLFVDTTMKNFEPKPGTTCTLVDKGAATNGNKTINASSYDLIGTARPQGNADDIGAYEAN